MRSTLSQPEKKRKRNAQTNMENTCLTPEQSDSLMALSKRGLQAEHFKNGDWFDSLSHVHALNYLVLVLELSINDALNKLKSFNEFQLQGIVSSDFSIEETEKLKTGEQFHFLRKYKHEGMTADDFINKAWFNSPSHLEAAINIFEAAKKSLNNSLTPQQVIAELDGLQAYQIAILKSGKYRRIDVEGLSAVHIKALYGFFINFGFKPNDFKDQSWLDDERLIERLKILVLQRHSRNTPQEILKKLKDETLGNTNNNTFASSHFRLHSPPKNVEIPQAENTNLSRLSPSSNN